MTPLQRLVRRIIYVLYITELPIQLRNIPKRRLRHFPWTSRARMMKTMLALRQLSLTSMSECLVRVCAHLRRVLILANS